MDIWSLENGSLEKVKNKMIMCSQRDRKEERKQCLSPPTLQFPAPDQKAKLCLTSLGWSWSMWMSRFYSFFLTEQPLLEGMVLFLVLPRIFRKFTIASCANTYILNASHNAMNPSKKATHSLCPIMMLWACHRLKTFTRPRHSAMSL